MAKPKHGKPAKKASSTTAATAEKEYSHVTVKLEDDLDQDDLEDENYTEVDDDDEEDEEPDLKTDAMILIEKIMEENQELSPEDEKRLKRELKRLEKEDEEEAEKHGGAQIKVEPDTQATAVEDEEVPEDEDEVEEEEEEEEEDVPLSEAEYDSDADLVPFQKLTVYNRAALEAALVAIRLPYEDLAFADHLSVTTAEPLVMRDVFDDLRREQAFEGQGLEAAQRARTQLPAADDTSSSAKFGVPAEEHAGEMVKRTGSEDDAEHAEAARRPAAAPSGGKLKRKRGSKGGSGGGTGADEAFQQMREEAEAQISEMQKRDEERAASKGKGKGKGKGKFGASKPAPSSSGERFGKKPAYGGRDEGGSNKRSKTAGPAAGGSKTGVSKAGRRRLGKSKRAKRF